MIESIQSILSIVFWQISLPQSSNQDTLNFLLRSIFVKRMIEVIYNEKKNKFTDFSNYIISLKQDYYDHAFVRREIYFLQVPII